MPCLFSKPSLDQRPGVTEQVAWPVRTDAGQGEATQEGLAPGRAHGALMGVWLAASKAPLALCPAAGEAGVLQRPGAAVGTLFGNITERVPGGCCWGREGVSIWL